LSALDFAQVDGARELYENLQKFEKTLDGREMEDIFLAAARGMATQIRQNAPVGPTKNLRKGIKAKKFRKKRKAEPASYVIADHKIAPHAHLVERGTILPRRPKTKKVMFRETGGAEGGYWKSMGSLGRSGAAEYIEGVWFGKEVEPMPANPFWTRGIRGSADRMSNNIVKKSLKLIEKRARSSR